MPLRAPAMALALGTLTLAAPAAAQAFEVHDVEPARVYVGTTLEIFGTGFPADGTYQILFAGDGGAGALFKGPELNEKDTPVAVCPDPARCPVQLALTPSVVRPDRLAVVIDRTFMERLRGDGRCAAGARDCDVPRVFLGDISVIRTAPGGAVTAASFEYPLGAGGPVRPPLRLELFTPALRDLADDTARALQIGLAEDFLGVKLGDAPGGKGVMLAEVVAGGRAAKAGLAKGDVLDKVLATPIVDAASFAAALSEAPGRNVILRIKRPGAPAPVIEKGVDLSDYPVRPPPQILSVLFVVGACSAVFLLFIMPFGGIVTWVERRVWARMQSRVGPNRVGPQGFLQWIADGLKNMQKEDLVPTDADSVLFRLAPYFVFLAVIGTFVVLPFGRYLIPADMNIGILYLTSVVALEVVGVLMSGWGSNSKWALIGGMRSAAQIISYEVPGGLAILTAVLMAGSLSTQDIIGAQGGAPWHWFICENPAAFCAFFVLFIALLAEGNRTPFDLPEAESELVSGFATEYSGFRYLVFFFAEWVNLYVIGAVLTTLYLGGWQLPGPEWWWKGEGGGAAGATLVLYVVLAGVMAVVAALWLFKLVWIGMPRWLQHAVGFPLFAAVTAGAGALAFLAPSSWHVEALRLIVFQVKAMSIVFICIWLRATLPRLRIDQMMDMCWKYLVPIGFGIFGFVALWVAYAPGWLRTAMHALLAVVLFGVIGAFFWRAWVNLKETGADVGLGARLKLAMTGYKVHDERWVRVGSMAEHGAAKRS
ncbi:MAG TPA: NADH-quinone oxidoreductase subunit H [Myxococcota bacterium]|nr:NADH-quinone oxidoreductase subunit H [Myxococcota bacterium]